MRSWIVAFLSVVEALVACAIFACSLELSRNIAGWHSLGHAATIIVRSTRRLAQAGIAVRISIEPNA
jgi:hypothetical protein